MKKKTWILAMAVLMVLGTAAGLAAFGDETAPGTDSDPLVSQSYVDAKTTYTPIQLTAGQQLVGKGGTEIILRSGLATAVGNAENGVSDLTAGADLATGAQVGLNHLLLIPRDDGRGITATTDVWVMVRGEYTVR